MNITDELRSFTKDLLLGYVSQSQHIERLNVIADRIDMEHERCMVERADRYSELRAKMNNCYIELPKDADGEYIHVGDMMEYGKARGYVIALMLSEYPKKWGGALHWGVQLEGEQAPTALDAFFHHYHEPTVEDVLEEFVARWMETHHDDTPALKAEYAAKLRLAEKENV